MSLIYTIHRDGKSKEATEAKAREFLLLGGKVEVIGSIGKIYDEVEKVFPQPEYRAGVAIPSEGGKASLYLSRVLNDPINYQPKEDKSPINK